VGTLHTSVLVGGSLSASLGAVLTFGALSTASLPAKPEFPVITLDFLAPVLQEDKQSGII
jgi:hypothetical protein